MKIHSVSAKNLAEAMKIAVRGYGEDIHIVYEREFPFGFLKRKWVEIGFFAGGGELSPPVFNLERSTFECEAKRLAELLARNDFSQFYTQVLVGNYIDKAVEKGEAGSREENEDYIVSLVRNDFLEDYDSNINPPSVLVLSSPFGMDLHSTASHMSANFSDSTKRVNSRRVRIVDAVGAVRLPEFADESEIVIVLVDFELFNSGICDALPKYIAIPGFAAFSSFCAAVRRCNGLRSAVITNMDTPAAIGNVFSLCAELGTKVLCFDSEKGCMTANEFRPLEKLVGFLEVPEYH